MNMHYMNTYICIQKLSTFKSFSLPWISVFFTGFLACFLIYFLLEDNRNRLACENLLMMQGAQTWCSVDSHL